MVPGVKKIPVLRYGLIVLLIVVLSGSAFYLYLHYNKAEKVRGNFQKMISTRENSSLIDSCIVELYSADNSSRMYALTGSKFYFNKFSRQLKNVHGIINTINANNKSMAGMVNNMELGDLVSEKKLKTGNYMRLMVLTDSLLKSASKLNSTLKYADNKVYKQPVVRHIKTVVRIDTIHPPASSPAPKKKFFGRLISAFSNKKDKKPASQVVLVQKRTDTTITTIAATRRVARVYNTDYSKIFDANKKLRANEREMLEINNRLIAQTIGSLKKYKAAEQQYIANSKEEINSSLATVLYEFKRLSGLMFLLLTIVVAIILYNIWKIFKNEKEMLVYSKIAGNYALSKSRFMASMSHEIRTPLNSIIGFSELLTQSKLTETQTEQTNAIRSSSKMLLDVVNEILDFSKYETGKMTFEKSPFSPYKAIEEIVDSLQVQAGKKNIILHHQLDLKKDLCVNGDCFRLKQVIINLVSNAVKFTYQGSVTVNAFLTEEKAGYSILNVNVRDTGLGIDKQHLPYIFDEFSQVASAQKTANYGGTGLGLAICKKIVELQGGSIKVSSKAGKGSVFSVILPIQLSDKEQCIKEETFVNETVLQQKVAGRHMLIAEDNKLNVLLVSTFLKKWQITFDVATNGRQALQLFEDNNYDMILTDIEMPEMGGIEFTQVVRANGNANKAATPILALTANVLKEDRDKYLSIGITGVVLKPFTEKNLIENVAAALNVQALLYN